MFPYLSDIYYPQESVPGLELRSRTDTSGLRPRDYALRSRNPVLVHLLDERLPVALLRQIWVNYSLEQAMPPRHQTLGEDERVSQNMQLCVIPVCLEQN